MAAELAARLVVVTVALDAARVVATLADVSAGDRDFPVGPLTEYTFNQIREVCDADDAANMWLRAVSGVARRAARHEAFTAALGAWRAEGYRRRYLELSS